MYSKLQIRHLKHNLLYTIFRHNLCLDALYSLYTRCCHGNVHTIIFSNVTRIIVMFINSLCPCSWVDFHIIFYAVVVLVFVNILLWIRCQPYYVQGQGPDPPVEDFVIDSIHGFRVEYDDENVSVLRVMWYILDTRQWGIRVMLYIYLMVCWTRQWGIIASVCSIWIQEK